MHAKFAVNQSLPPVGLLKTEKQGLFIVDEARIIWLFPNVLGNILLGSVPYFTLNTLNFISLS